MLFPFVVIWAMYHKIRMKLTSYGHEIKFDKRYGVLYEEFRLENNPFTFYWSVYMMRRIIFVIISFYMWEDQYTMF